MSIVTFMVGSTSNCKKIGVEYTFVLLEWSAGADAGAVADDELAAPGVLA